MLVREPSRQGRLNPRRGGAFWIALAALLLGGLFFSPAAGAAYEQVGTFAGNPGELHGNLPFEEGESFDEYSEKNAKQWPEKVQLGGLGGMAVNYTGAGGVPAGTIYAVASVSNDTHLVRYNPDRSFSEAWQTRTKQQEEASEAKGEAPYRRCGPDGEEIEEEAILVHLPCLPRSANGGESRNVAVAVDQTTGYVYVYKNDGVQAGTLAITVYSADGSEVISRFAEIAGSEYAQEAPAKVHSGGGIAVNAAGEVFVFDNDGPENNFYHRLMVFKPKTPGDYTEYEYAGQSHDIAAGFFGETNYPTRPVVDAAGNVYVAGYDHVEKYDPSHPDDPPICSFLFKKGQISAATVNPLTGEAFFYSSADKKLRRLNPCAEGKFSEAESIDISPKRDFLDGMAVDPMAQLSSGRSAGILYAGVSGGVGGETKGSPPNVETESSMGYFFAPPLEIPPQVLSEAVAGVTQTSARLEGSVNPRGNPTRYVFRYISDAAYQANEPGEPFAGAIEAPVGGALVEGSKAFAAATTVSGLAPGTEYHVRLVASSHCSPGEPEKTCTAEGPGRSFRTYPSQAAGLPDRRAYELVSPTEKNGGQVFPVQPEVNSCGFECKPGWANGPFPRQSAPDGNAVVYEGSAFSFNEGALIENQYIARRSDSGWQTSNLTPSRLSSKGGTGYKAFSADLGLGVLEQEGGEEIELTPDSPPGFYNLYTQPSAEPLSLTPFLTEAPPNRATGHTSSNRLQLSFAGASADMSRLFFRANDALTPEAEGGPEAKGDLYESSGGELHLVNFAPGNAATLPGAVFGSGELLNRGNSNILENFVFHAISEDGSRVFWTSEEDGNLYVREDGGVTRQVPDPNSCSTSLLWSERTCFLTASADGSGVLLSDGLLFDVEDLAAPPVDLTGGKGGFRGVAGQSEDLSRIYFADTKVLTGEEENEYGDKAEEAAGKVNLYAWHESTTTFIATLPAGSDEAKEAWELAPVHRSASASPDGAWFAFMTRASLTGFDNAGPCAGPCSEVFLYQAETGRLSCASCNRTGVEPRGESHLLQLSVLRTTSAFQPPRYLSDSGRLFFDSADSLSPFDTNGRVEDVYELEPNGVGDCAREEGCVRLISAGSSGEDSNFVTMDPSGRNAFFTSRDQLVGTDRDELVDLYDAREGGGFPPEARSGECQGEACLPSVSPPGHPPSSSAGFRGPGNEKATDRPCAKGRYKASRKGKVRCAKHRRKGQRHRKDHRRPQSHRGRAK